MVWYLFFIFSLIHCIQGRNGTQLKKWMTQDGSEPIVIARGGYSGLFPDSSIYALKFAIRTSLPNMALFCDLQLTKDSQGFCQTGLQLNNSTSIGDVFPKGKKEYVVNGQKVDGWFASDYTYDQLRANVTLSQNMYARTQVFDGTLRICSIEDVRQLKPPPPHFWLNVQYPSFLRKHKLNPAFYVEKTLRVTKINYISSPDIRFLKTLHTKVNKAKTKLIFRFLEKHMTEPTTNQTYGSILGNLSYVKSFASGILIPKHYIWPVNQDMYLEPATALVSEAHKASLKVYASGFASDQVSAYNYSYDPTAEYLQFIDNSQFAVDGVLTDFPSTASESIACLAHNKNAARPSKGPLIISHNGASGVYAGSTDLAYEQAIADGTDIIDCSVQLSKDGIPFCLESADLSGVTTAAQTFMNRSKTIPEIQENSGIFSFDFTWSEIQSLQPEIGQPFLKKYTLRRNPANRNKGMFMTLSAFLQLAQMKAVTGISIKIHNAAYLASNKGFRLTDIIASALSNATFDKQQTQKVLIQSDDTQVLLKFKNNRNYQKVMFIYETISVVPNTTLEEIKKYADAVMVRRPSIVKSLNGFTSSFTNVVDSMHKANISVYVFVLRNEFVNLDFDYLSDPMVELATFIDSVRVDGVVTDYPATANAYLRSPCFDPKSNSSYRISAIKAGDFLQSLIPPEALPPTPAPAPALTVADVDDPPLSPLSIHPAAPTRKSKSDGGKIPVQIGGCLVGILLLFLWNVLI